MARSNNKESEVSQVTSLTGSINEDDPVQLFNFDALRESYEDEVNTEIAARFGTIALERTALDVREDDVSGAEDLAA